MFSEIRMHFLNYYFNDLLKNEKKSFVHGYSFFVWAKPFKAKTDQFVFDEMGKNRNKNAAAVD